MGRLRQRGPLFRSDTDEKSPIVTSTTTLNERTPDVTDHVSVRCLLALTCVLGALTGTIDSTGAFWAPLFVTLAQGFLTE